MDAGDEYDFYATVVALFHDGSESTVELGLGIDLGSSSLPIADFLSGWTSPTFPMICSDATNDFSVLYEPTESLFFIILSVFRNRTSSLSCFNR